jgi:hypothetical protein
MFNCLRIAAERTSFSHQPHATPTDNSHTVPEMSMAHRATRAPGGVIQAAANQTMIDATTTQGECSRSVIRADPLQVRHPGDTAEIAASGHVRMR